MNDLSIVIPVHSTRHPMLQACVANVRATTGMEPIVWEESGNVAVARDEATRAVDTEFVLFLDTDAFPQGRDWHEQLLGTARSTGAAVVSPHEVPDFVDYRRRDDIGGVRQHTGRPNVAGMCLLVRRGWRLWDRSLGLTAGFLGPAIEDTDFAYSVEAAGGSHWMNLDVDVLHRDRGARTIDEWMHTDEFLAYEVLSELIRIKWALALPDMFKHLGKVPGRDQRRLADGYTRDDLLDCYRGIVDDIPAAHRKGVMIHIESTADRFRS